MKPDIWHDPLFLAGLKRGGAGGSASGDIVTFIGDGSPLRALRLAIDPVQDLHGYDNPWPGGGGINLLDISIASPLSVTYGLTKSIDSSGFVHLDGIVDGTGEALSIAVIKAGDAQIDALTGKNYVISMTDVSGGTVKSAWGLRDIDNGAIACSITNPGNGTEMHMKFRVVVATTKQTTFAPYSNICPISGWDSVTAWRTGKNLLDPAKKRWVQDSNMYFFLEGGLLLNAGTYVLSYKGENNLSGIYASVLGGANIAWIYNKRELTFTLAEQKRLIFNFYDVNHNLADDMSLYQLELSSTPTAYTPYTGNQYTIQLGQTVYGGYISVSEDGSAELVADYRLLNAADVTWRKSGDVVFYAPSDLYTTVSADTPTGRKPLLCNTFSYYSGSSVRDGDIGYGGINNNGNITIRSSVVAFTLEDWNDYIANNTVQIVYPLATPITYPLSSIAVTTLAGQNVVWADCGEVAVEWAGGKGFGKDAMLAWVMHR